jgi:hypothetical protein
MRPRGVSKTGKVARLPKTLRDQINQMLRDGLSYPAIIKKLQPPNTPSHQHSTSQFLPYPILEKNLSHWQQGGHQDWLKEQAWIEKTRARQETALDLMGDFDATQVNHAALQLGTLHIFEALRDLGPGSLDKRLGGDSGAFARLLNALSRSSRETLQLQKYRDACVRARAELQNLRDPKRPLTEEENRAIVLKVDDILGLRSPEGPAVGYSPEVLAKAQELLRTEAVTPDEDPRTTKSAETSPPEPQ